MLTNGQVSGAVNSAVKDLHDISISLKRIAYALEVQNGIGKTEKKEPSSKVSSVDSNRE